LFLQGFLPKKEFNPQPYPQKLGISIETLIAKGFRVIKLTWDMVSRCGSGTWQTVLLEPDKDDSCRALGWITGCFFGLTA